VALGRLLSSTYDQEQRQCQAANAMGGKLIMVLSHRIHRIWKIPFLAIQPM
jgi:hypothetical protein